MLPTALAGQAQPLELAVKAAFLPKFARYVSWPASAQPAAEPFQLCILGGDTLGKLIDEAAAGEAIDRRPINVRRLPSADQAQGCGIVFLQGANSRDNGAALAALARRPMLTVTDQNRGNARGMVHFVVHQGRVRFHIDAAAAARAGLSIDSRLLSLALSVRQRP